MIAHEHEAIFVHLRRTAGNSIEFALGGIELFDESGRPTDRWVNELHRGSRTHKRAKRGHYIHDTALTIRKRYPREFERYFKFSVVRNPWAQMVSLHQRLHPRFRWRWRFRRWLRTFRAAICPRTVTT